MPTAQLSIDRLRMHYTRPKASESTKLERESKIRCHKNHVLTKCSAQRNRLRAFPGPIESYDPKDGAGKRSSQTNSWLARYFHLKGTKTTNNLVTRKIKLSLQPYYSSSEEGFPSHMSVLTNLSKTHRQTPHLHFWIGDEPV